MARYRMLSWNVNGIRAVYKKGFLDWLQEESPDILGVQETKAHEDQLVKALQAPPGYHAYFDEAERKGYSGVAIYTKEEPIEVTRGLVDEAYNHEGRTLVAEYERFVFLTIYYPNGKQSPERLQYKLGFYDAFLRTLDELREKGKPLIICGDVNTAHHPIDLARPKNNEDVSGFLPEERAVLDRFLEWGLVDTFREFEEGPDHYTWWDYKSRARSRNVGWRIDYFYVDGVARPALKDAFILSDVMGSDHCPIGIEMDFS